MEEVSGDNRNKIMPHTIQPMASIDATWYGIILAAIFSILQLIYKVGSAGGDLEGVDSHFHLLKKTVSLYVSISLISLTSCKPLPSSKRLKISLLFAILAVATTLSAAVLCKLWWVPYLSCIRPLFDLLRELYLFADMPLDPFWKFCNSIGSAAYQFKLKAHQFIQLLVNINKGASSPAQANSNSEGAMRTTEA